MIKIIGFLLFLCSITKMTRATCQQDIQACQNEAGISNAMSGKGTADMDAICSSGKFEILVDCMQRVLRRCGLAHMYDMSQMQSGMSSVCANKEVFVEQESCMRNKQSTFTSCGTHVAEGLKEYIQDNDSPDLNEIMCNIYQDVDHVGFVGSWDYYCVYGFPQPLLGESRWILPILDEITFGGIKNCIKVTYTPCDKRAADALITIINAFSPKACHSYTTCSFCGAERMAKVSLLLLIAIFCFHRLL